MLSTRLVCAGALALALAPPAVVRAQAIATDRLEAIMISGGGGRDLGIPLVEEHLDIKIDGQFASTRLLQVYQHGNGTQIEGRYRLRAGLGSHVEGFAYWNGEQKILGEVFERQAAKRVYDNVTARKRDPGLLEEDGAGAFAFKVFPIQPNEKKRVEVRWTKWLERRGQTVQYRAPITRPDAEIVIEVDGAIKNLRSPTHKLHVEKFAGGVRLRSEGGRPGSLVLEWDVDELEWQPNAFVHAGNDKGDGWFALSLATTDVNTGAIAPKDVTIVIDKSGSMIGDPMDQAKAAAIDMIKLLNPNDRVNVISFSDEVDPLFKFPQTADTVTRERASAFVDRMHEGGGTDLALALTTAITSQDKRDANRPRVVVFMTDGQSDVDRAMAAAKADTGDIRLFTLGLGKEVNQPLLQRLAAIKRGKFTWIEHAAQIQPEVTRLAKHISKPLLVDVSVDVVGAQAVRLYPRSLPDLFTDDELVVTGRLRGTGSVKFVIKGRLAGKPVAFSRTVDVARAPSRPWVGRLWAQARVEHLLEEIALGAKEPELVTEATDLALAYNFVTPYTSFLAIPESELGSERGTVDAMRARKKKIMAENPDVATITEKRPDPGNVAINQPPQLSPPPGQPDMRRGADSLDSRGDEPKAKRHVAMRESEGDDDAVGEAPRHHTMSGSASRTHGCAGCASGGDGSIAFVGLALLGLVVRRRR